MVDMCDAVNDIRQYSSPFTYYIEFDALHGLCHSLCPSRQSALVAKERLYQRIAVRTLGDIGKEETEFLEEFLLS